MKRISMGLLPNGFRFYTYYVTAGGGSKATDHVSGVGVEAGSIHDPRDAIGMNHLLEHLGGFLSEEEELKCEEYGCGPDESINIRCDRSSTFYGHDLIARREFKLELFEIFGRNVLQIPGKIGKEGLERERAAVYNEYLMRSKDWPEGSIDDWMHAVMYEDGQNPASSRVDCEPDHLQRVRVQDLRRYHAANYGSDTMFAILMGEPYQKVKRIAEERFGHLKPTNRPKIVVPVPRPALSGVRYVEVEKRGIHQYHVGIGFPTHPYGHHDDIAIDLLGHLWRWRMRGHLRFDNREWGKGTYRALAFTPRTFAHGMIYLWFATPSLEFAEYGAEMALKECARLREEFVPDLLLNTFWNKLANAYREAFLTSTGTLAELVIEAACNGDPEMKGLNSYLGHLQRVGKKAIRRVANEYMTPGAYVHLLLKPAPSEEPNETIKSTLVVPSDIKTARTPPGTTVG